MLETMITMLVPSDRWTRFLVAPALVFIAAVMDRNYQTDLWHHLARGRAIVAEDRLLDEDRFTFTVYGQPLRDPNWGWQLLFYRLYARGGLPLIQTINAALLAAAMAFLIVRAWRRSGSLIAAAAFCLVAFLGLWQLILIRPQTFSILLFVLMCGVLEGARHRRPLFLAAPLLMALWANVHGGFPVGLLLIGCYVAAELFDAARTRSPVALRTCGLWLLCLLGSVAATLVNPYGWNLYEYVVQTSKAASGRAIDEWLPPGWNSLTGKVWVFSLAALVVGLALSPRRPTTRELCLLGCFLPLSCGSVRMVAWWLLICTPILAAQFAALWPRLQQLDSSDDHPSLGNTLTCSFLLAAMLLSTPWLEASNPILSRPGRAHRTETDLQALADRLRAEGHGGRIFTRFAWGEYLGWSLTPAYTVFMDGRIEIIPDKVWAQYNAVTRGRADWQEILSYYDVQYLVLDDGPYHRQLLPFVRRSPAWHETARQGDAILFERQAKALQEPSSSNLPK
jgi:hypothetical protein